MQKMMKRMGMGGGKKGKRLGMPGMGGLGGKNMPDMAELEQMMGGGGQFPADGDLARHHSAPRARTSSPPLNSNVASTASSVSSRRSTCSELEHQRWPQLEHVRCSGRSHRRACPDCATRRPAAWHRHTQPVRGSSGRRPGRDPRTSRCPAHCRSRRAGTPARRGQLRAARRSWPSWPADPRRRSRRARRAPPRPRPGCPRTC